MVLKTGRLLAAFAFLALAGCNETSVKDFSPKAERPLPEKVITAMKAKGMSRGSPVMVRIFKEEGVLEVWKRKDNGRFDMLKTYDICKMSGELGPKFKEGDRQAPEGFYTIRPGQMNPNSDYYLSFNIGFPNAFDRANGRSGAHLMVHGACSSSGCYSMSDESIAEIFAFGRDSFRGGQTEFQLQAFPFRMTAANMARYRNDPNFPFWEMLKEGYDQFEITKLPPKVDVCGKRYVFNQIALDGKPFDANAACPQMALTSGLQSAYATHQSSYKAAFAAAAEKSALPAPKATIAGPKEAAIVAEWSRARAAGKKVSRLPPSLEAAAGQASAEAAAKAELAVPTVAPVPVARPEAAAPAAVKTAEAADEAVAVEAAAQPKKRWWQLGK